MINVSYCPNKKFADEFLENLARGIDRVVSQNMPVILMGDYNLNYWANQIVQQLIQLLFLTI